MNKKKIYGMIHLSNGDAENAYREMCIYHQNGLAGCIVENYHGSVDDVERALGHLRFSSAIHPSWKIGVNILPNEFEKAYALAKNYRVHFIQLDHVGGTYLRNTTIDQEQFTKCRNANPTIEILGGIWPKYYTPTCHNLSQDEQNKQLILDLIQGVGNADSIVVTGSGTGSEVPIDKISQFRFMLNHIKKDVPLIIGAGMRADNISLLDYADGAIVGSAFKPNGNTNLPVDETLVEEFMKALKDRYEN